MPVTQIVLAGDSIAAGEITAGGFSYTGAGGLGSWAELLAEGIANLGIYGPLVGAGIRPTAYAAQWSGTGTWTSTVSTDAFDKSFFGLAPYAANAATKTYTHPTQWRHCAGFAIYWIDYAAGGNWQYRVDGGTWINVDATETRLGDNQLKKFYVNTPVTSTVDFRAFNGTANAGLCLCGIEPFFVDPRGLDTGFVFHNVAHSGDFLFAFVPAGSGDRLAFFDSVVLGSGNPISNRAQLVFGGTFTNDVVLFNATTYAANIHIVQQRVVAAGGQFAWINAYEETTARNTTNQQSLRTAAKTQANTDGFPYIDLFDLYQAQGFGGVGAQNNNLQTQVWVDTLHPYQAGHLDIGRKLVQWAYTSVLTDRTRHRSQPFVVGRSQNSGTDILGGTLEVDPAVRFHRVRPKPPGRRAPSGVGFAPRVSHTGDRQAITPAGIASTVAFGAPRDVITFHTTGIASAASVATAFSTTIAGTYFLTLTGLSSAVAFGAPTLDPVTDLFATGIAPSELIPRASATTVRDVKTCSPTGLASTVAFGTPALSSGSQAQLFPTGIPSVATVPVVLATSIVIPATLDRQLRLRPPGRRAPNGIGFRRYVPGGGIAAQTVHVYGIPPNGTYTDQAGDTYTNQAGDPYTTQHFPTIGVPAISRVRTLAVTGIASTVRFGVPNVRGPARIRCTGIPSTLAFGAPTFTRFQTAILPAGIASTVRFGTVGSKTTTGLTGIASTVRFGTVNVSYAAQWNVKEPRPRWSAGFPHGRWHAWDADLPNTAITYRPISPPVGPTTSTLRVTAISSTVAFGDIAFPAPEQTATIAAIAPTAAFGAPSIGFGAARTLTVVGISPTSRLGSVTLGTSLHSGPLGIASTLQFGVPTVARPARRTITITGIAPTSVLGQNTLAKRPNKKTLSPTGRASTVAFGVPAVSRVVVGPPPPPPDVIVPFSVVDPTGVTDCSDTFIAWFNASPGGVPNVPNGTDAAHPTRVLLRPTRANGTPAQYRMEGGASGGMHISNKHDIVIDGGGANITMDDTTLNGTLLSGGDGAKLIQTTLPTSAQDPGGRPIIYVAQGDPDTNPRGFYDHNGGTIDSVPPYGSFITYAAGDVIVGGAIGSQRRYRSKLAGNLNHPVTDTTWWQNISADGLLTSRHNVDWGALGIVAGTDQIQVQCPPNLHPTVTYTVTATHNSYILTNPKLASTGAAATFDTTDNGARVTATATGFPTGNETIATFLTSSSIALSAYYTGPTTTITVTLDQPATNRTIRTITAINVGGDPTVLAYSGGSLGSGTVDLTINPSLPWAVIYTPTNTVESTVSSYTAAADHAADMNRGRSMFILTGCNRVNVRGFHMIGTHYGGWDALYEAQDAFRFIACNDCEVGDNLVEDFWGNGLEMMSRTSDDVGCRRLWVHDNKFSGFGRQAHSLTYGYGYIGERNYYGESARSLFDMEPTTSTIPTGTNPTLTYTMQDIHLIDCLIGDHGLGMLSCHEGLGKVHVLRPKGKRLGTSGVAIVDYFIFEAGVSNVPGTALTSYEFQFDTGVRKGGNHMRIVNNQDVHSRVALVFLGNTNGPCTDVEVHDNDAGAVPQCQDAAGNTHLTGSGFLLPLPSHALRDLALAGP